MRNCAAGSSVWIIMQGGSNNSKCRDQRN